MALRASGRNDGQNSSRCLSIALGAQAILIGVLLGSLYWPLL